MARRRLLGRERLLDELRQPRAETGDHLKRLVEISRKSPRAEGALDVVFNDGLCDFPDIELGAEAARNAFDNDHGTLKKDKFGAGFHAETLGDFEKVAQKLAHGYAGRIHAEDGFTDRAQRPGEFIDVTVTGDIPRLEMNLGDALIVALDEAIENLGVDAARVFVDMAHDAEVEGDDVAVRGDFQISLVHVRVEKAVAQGMAQEELQNTLSQLVEIMPGSCQRRVVAEGDPFGPGHGHDAAMRKFPQDRRKGESL